MIYLKSNTMRFMLKRLVKTRLVFVQLGLLSRLTYYYRLPIRANSEPEIGFVHNELFIKLCDI